MPEILTFKRPRPQAVTFNEAPTFREVAEEWYRWKTEGGHWVQGVRENVARMKRRWTEEHFGDVPINEVSTTHVELLEKARAATGIVASSLNLERSYLRACFKWARTHREWGLEDDPLATWLPRTEVVAKEYAPFTAEGEEAFYLVAPPWLSQITLFAINTGVRRGTLLKLKVGMIHWRTIRLSTGREKEAAVIHIPARIMKAKKDHKVPLNQNALDAIGSLRGRKPDELLFPGLPGKSVIAHAFKRAVRKAGLPDSCSFHDTRRTFVSRLSAKGVPMHVIMKLGPWSRPTTMLIHYCSLSDDEALQVLEKI